jgi:RNA polymerase sigma factor (sigma-70 family)
MVQRAPSGELMARKGPTEQDNEQQGLGARIHYYLERQKPQLSVDSEHQLALQIQQGNLALDELQSRVTESLISSLQHSDLTPLTTTAVEDALRPVIRDQLTKCAGAKLQRQEFVQEVPALLRDTIGDLLDEADQRDVLDTAAWLDTHLSEWDIESDLLTVLSESAGSWSELVAREAAMSELAESHLGMARPFAMKAMRQAFEFDDLLNEAFLLLRRAAETFDPHGGTRFSSYATTALGRGLKRTSPSRIGLKRPTAVQLRAFDDAQHTLSQQPGPSPSVNAVYELLGCNQRTRIQIENVRRVLGARQQSQREGDSHREESLHAIDSQAANPADEAGDREEQARLAAALDKLTPLEQTVITGVFKLGKSFRTLAKDLHKSPSTLSDVCKEALEKLARRIDSKWVPPKPR